MHECFEALLVEYVLWELDWHLDGVFPSDDIHHFLSVFLLILL